MENPRALAEFDDVTPRNEVKTRLTDREFEALQRVKRQYKLPSDAKALQRMARVGLFGQVG